MPKSVDHQHLVARLRQGHQLGEDLRIAQYHYAHRPGSPLCAYNPLSALRLADRDGADEDDLIRCALYIISETPALAPKVQALLEDWKIDVQSIR